LLLKIENLRTRTPGGFVFPHDIATDRLLLRVPVPEDAQRIFGSYTQDPKVARYLTWRPAKTLADSERHIHDRILAWRSGNICAWSVVETERGIVIGMIELRIKGEAADVGYVIARAEWGKGYATEALKAVIEDGFVHPEIARLVAVCDVENAASARVMEKAGMVQEGILPRHMLAPNISDEPRDVFSYSITRS
jgi:RimJ/RimL family protein N-acetyltransferase